MVFSSLVFLFCFLPVSLLLYYLTPRRYRNAALLLVSLVFYGWGEPVFLLLMLAVILLNYGFGLLISRRKERGRPARAALAWSIVFNLGILGFFKYAGFFIESLRVLPLLRFLPVPEISLPIGISFYIFQSMSYTIDVYRGEVAAQRSLIRFGTYVSLFPQLIAGPIVRYRDVAEQLDTRRESFAQFASGVCLFLIGLAKKLLLANPTGAFWADLQLRGGTASAWMGMFAYSLQLYFDFSGYSDMAIGLGRMFGFEFRKNFDYPYISRSFTEYWKRWHISLGTWFREYVYIPLGGNRRGLPRQLLNILIVWTLTGLWHGANWNYVLWGLYSAVLLIAEKLFLSRFLRRLPALLQHGLLLLAAVFGNLIFYFEDLTAFGAFVGRLVTPAAADAAACARMLGFLPLFLIAAVAATPLGARLYERGKERPLVQGLRIPALAALFLLCLASLASQGYNPFIYFRF